jgi:hypothetical protein
MSSRLEHIMEEARALSAEEQTRLREMLSGPALAANGARETIARQLFGKYAHAATSSAEFSARKASDILLEEHPSL